MTCWTLGEIATCTVPAAAPAVGAPLGQVPLAPPPPPPPPPPATTLGWHCRVPAGADTAPGENDLLAVGPPREDAHSCPNRAEQRRAGFILHRIRLRKKCKISRGRCLLPVSTTPGHWSEQSLRMFRPRRTRRFFVCLFEVHKKPAQLTSRNTGTEGAAKDGLVRNALAGSRKHFKTAYILWQASSPTYKLSNSYFLLCKRTKVDIWKSYIQLSPSRHQWIVPHWYLYQKGGNPWERGVNFPQTSQSAFSALKYRNDAWIYGSDVTEHSSLPPSHIISPSSENMSVDRPEQETQCQPSTYTNNMITFKELICFVTGHEVNFLFLLLVW